MLVYDAWDGQYDYTSKLATESIDYISTYWHVLNNYKTEIHGEELKIVFQVFVVDQCVEPLLYLTQLIN